MTWRLNCYRYFHTCWVNNNIFFVNIFFHFYSCVDKFHRRRSIAAAINKNEKWGIFHSRFGIELGTLLISWNEERFLIQIWHLTWNIPHSKSKWGSPSEGENHATTTMMRATTQGRKRGLTRASRWQGDRGLAMTRVVGGGEQEGNKEKERKSNHLTLY